MAEFKIDLHGDWNTIIGKVILDEDVVQEWERRQSDGTDVSSVISAYFKAKEGGFEITGFSLVELPAVPNTFEKPSGPDLSNLRAAWETDFNHPNYHLRCKEDLEDDWPTLAKAIKELLTNG